jgi:hypothetical protein
MLEIILAAALSPGLCHLRNSYTLGPSGLRWCEYGCENGKQWVTGVPVAQRCKPTVGD